MRLTSTLLFAALALGEGRRAQAQAPVTVMGQAIGVVESVDPVPGGGTLTEARVVQPVVMLHGRWFGGRLRALGTLNLEGVTIPCGELTPGGWGEGFIDRRHPHTYAHELIVSAVDVLGRLDGGARLSVSAGKGFAPFGSDDPMSRPVLRYPVNHHLAQVLERAVLVAGYRAGPVALEGGLFNGDEPERPGQWPKWSRFGDSWSARLTVLPVTGVELSASRARVKSPEHRPGAGATASKWHAAVRLDRPVAGGRGYLLAEWARTSEADGFFVFQSGLAEVAWSRGAHRPYYRFEQTDRPEDVRTPDPFRSLRPHLENSIVGVTRFALHTIGYGYGIRTRAGLELRPFAELTLGRMRETQGAVFDPKVFYGRTTIRALSVGLRLGWRMEGHRMGRYGDLLGEPAMHTHQEMMP